MKIVVTGAGGLIGTHAAIRIHARNCAARYAGKADPFEFTALSHAEFDDDTRLERAVSGADAVLHFAGVNRGEAAQVETANPAIAERLLSACDRVGARPHIVYANSTQAEADTPYGRGKARAAALLKASGLGLTDLILPHIFGEGARPRYNNVTATLIEAALHGATPQINPDGRVSLLHAGRAADMAIEAAVTAETGRLAPQGLPLSVPALWAKITAMHAAYAADLFPDLTDPFDAALFNCYRAAIAPADWTRPLHPNADARGVLFEAAKGGGGGQVFFSATHPGITRGDHFHLHKVERFVVVEGEAVIRIRKALGETVWSQRVSGAAPIAIDMPTLHTHSIENVGENPLLTLFWADTPFDPTAPDTYADKVLP